MIPAPLRIAIAISAASLSIGCDAARGGGGGGDGGYAPVAITDDKAAETEWNGRRWRVNAGVLRNSALSYAIQTDGEGRIRFELRDTPDDRSPKDSADTRRAEISGSLYGDRTRLPNGIPLWGAMSFVHHGWSDPEGMRAHMGGVYGQIHMGSRLGGSPALAFRRTKDGAFRITTRGQLDEEGTVQFEAPVAFDQPHDLVYRVVLHPTDGSLQVWLDGERIVARDNLSIGHESADSFWNLGLYFARGISGQVVAEYAHHAYPSREALDARTRRPPAWPR